MYPYHIQTKNTLLHTKERTQPNLSGDRRLREMLLLAKKDAASLEKKYDALSQTLKPSEPVLQNMATDQKKHQRILQEVLFTIFSDTFEDVLEEIAEETFEGADAEDLLEELLFAELDDITFLRPILAAMEEDDLWDLIFEILTDKQNHAAALNHLYAKHFANPPVQNG